MENKEKKQLKISDKELDQAIKDIESTQITRFYFCRETILTVFKELKMLREKVSKSDLEK